MKKIYALLLLVSGIATGFAQTVYTENFGTGGSNSTTVTAFTGYQAAGITYAGDATVRTTSGSTTYSNASGGNNIFFGSSTTQSITISGINTSAYNTADLVLTFGQNQGSVATGTASNLILSVSTDGTNFTTVPYTRPTTATGWELVTVPGGSIPSATNVRLRFTQASAIQYRIDDVAIKVQFASCTLTLGTESKACAAVTDAIDTYTVTLPFENAGNADYTVTTNVSGVTIGGANPDTAASGDILVSGIPEGQDITITVTGGTCNFTRSVTAATCKPVYTLPYAESFQYASGINLTSTQKWSSANSGDEVTVGLTSLNYPGITSTGNSATYSGQGAEAWTQFTTVSSGKIYAGFIMTVSDLSNVTPDQTQTIFAALTGTTVGSYNVRLFVKTVGTQFQIGLDKQNDATTNYATTLFNVNQPVMVLCSFDYATLTMSAWINPDLSTFTASTTPTLTESFMDLPSNYQFGGFVLRQDAATTTPTIIVDELRVATDLSFLSTKSFNDIAGLTLYPNPVNGGVLNIASDSGADKTLAVYDVLGKNVLSATVANEAVNVSALTSGVYIVKITEEGKTATRKLVVK